MLQQKKGWGEKTVTAMYTSKDDLTPLLYSGKIKKKKKKRKQISNSINYTLKKRKEIILVTVDT